MKFPIKYQLSVVILIICAPLFALSVFHYFEMAGYDKHLSGHYLTMLIIAVFSALGLSMLFGRNIAKKVSALSAGLREVERGNLHYRLEISGNDELHDLAESFNAMTSFLSAVLDGMGEGLIVIDRDFKVLLANKGYCAQVRMPCESIIGRHCYELSHHIFEPCYEIENGCTCTVKQCFDTGKSHRALHTHFDKDGNVIYIETSAYPLRDQSGVITSAIETTVDVTERVMLEKRLEEVKERYRKLYDDAPDMMHSIDKSGTVIICNKTEAETLGYDSNEIIGQPFTKIIAPEERQACMQKFDVIKREGFFEGDLTLIAKSGRRIPAYVKTKAIYDENNDFLMTDAVIRDITDIRSLEAQLLQAQKMEAIGQLAGGIAHDFNNILTTIMGYGSLLRNKMDNDLLKKYVEQILSSAERATSLTSSLLAFGRKQLIRLRPVRLSEVVSRMEIFLWRIIGEDIELKTFASPHEHAVMIDVGQVEQILMNLCANARDAMPDGGIIMIETEPVEFDEAYVSTHAFTKPGKYMLVSITDTGTGMDEEIKAKIFEPYFTTKEVGKGSGLGLAIVYGIVKQHGGFINVYSEKGKGTTFKIYLPIIEKEAESLGSAPDPNYIPVVTGTETILFAEDESMLRQYVKEALEEHGYKVVEAEDGEDAVEKFKAHADSIDLLILDVMMPKKNGKEAFDEIRRYRPGMKAVFISGYTANIIHKKGILKADIELVAKPFSPNVLLKKIRAVLDA